jgi:hypothetical protein
MTEENNKIILIYNYVGKVLGPSQLERRDKIPSVTVKKGQQLNSRGMPEAQLEEKLTTNENQLSELHLGWWIKKIKAAFSTL